MHDCRGLQEVTRIPKKAIKKWVEELRSGKWKQTTAMLQNQDSFCCLGVACKLFIPDTKQRTDIGGELRGGTPLCQPAAPKWLQQIDLEFKTKLGIGQTLTDINDSGKTFPEIADLLEETYLK
jgi:hypothetical protein